ncbi:response regulator [Mariniblastus sp.]|nr:response regulator [Mariniblastus sp.]MDB4368255.1 response regulator [Mariniblastus sp.]MDC0294183.1 response regulator [Mariniblastus sp.]
MDLVTPSQCELFYPFVIGLDGNNKIVYVSERLNAKLSRGSVGKRFDKVFELNRPRVDWNDKSLDLSNYRAHLFLFSNLSGTFGLRGQVIPGTLNGREIVLIAASPWLTWLNENVEHYQPNFFDFSVQDAQLDFNLHLHTQSVMLDDMQRLTEQLMRARDEAQAADRAKSMFVSHVSHELRTPLTGITGLIELMEDQPLNDESLDLLETLRTSSDYLMHVVNQVLDFSRMRDGAETLKIEPFNLKSMVNSTVAILEPQAVMKGLKLSVFISPNVPKWLDGDVFKIRKSLTNLISNAIKYSDEGQIQVAIMATAEDARAINLSFSVSDQGPGIAVEDRPLLFREFWTKDAPGTNKIASTGLGLSITRGLIEQMGGQIGMRSAESLAGSIFWFDLTLNRSKQIDHRDQHSVETEFKQYSARLLIVDDNSVNRKVANLMFNKFGLTIEEVSSGQDAIAAMDDPQFDLILMDIQMPQINGLEATRLIKEKLGASTPKIIAWSANCTEEDIVEYRNAGMDDVLTKPVNKKAIAQLLNRALN